MADTERKVAPLPSEPPMNGGLSGPALDEISDRLIHAAKNGTPVRLEDVRKIVVHLHSTEAYAALRQSAYTNNALGLEQMKRYPAKQIEEGVTALVEREMAAVLIAARPQQEKQDG